MSLLSRSGGHRPQPRLPPRGEKGDKLICRVEVVEDEGVEDDELFVFTTADEEEVDGG